MKRRALLAVVIVAFAATSGFLALAQKPGKKSPHRGLSPAEARALEGLVDGTVRAYGTLESAGNIELRCQLPGGSRILYVVEDGTKVKKGDVLVRLESSALSEKFVLQKIASLQARAAAEQSEEEIRVAKVAVLESKGRTHSSKAAHLALNEYTGKGGQYELDLKSVEGEIRVAEARLKLAKKSAARLHNLKEKGAVDENRYNEAELALLEAEEEARAARAKKQVLVQYTQPRQKAVLEAAVEKAEWTSMTNRREAEAALSKAQSQLKANVEALVLEEQRLDHLKEQLQKAVIRAPRDGFVLHSTRGRRASSGTAIEVGATVSEQQPIIVLPDLSRLQVRVLVAEVDVDRIEVGQPVKIRFLVYPDRAFEGKVLRVTTIPEQRSWYEADVKEYGVIVSIEKPAPRLKIGMTSVAEIDVSSQPTGK